MADTPAPYRIRLRGGWQPMDVPSSAPRWQARRFGRPTNLGPRDTVWLVFAPTPPVVEVRLNGASLTVEPATSSVEITRLLNERNQLEVLVEPADAVMGDVILEIRPGPPGGQPSTDRSRDSIIPET